MKRLISLFSTLLLASAVSAQNIEEIQRQALQQQKQYAEMYKDMMPTYADTLGVYAVHGDKIECIDPIKMQNTKIGASPFTAKASIVFPRTTSRQHFNGTAVLRIYLGTPKPQDTQRYYMFSNGKTPDDFAIVKFKIKKGTRRLKTFSSGFFGIGGGSSVGAGQADDISIESTKLRDNLYEIRISGPAGEYGVAPISNGSAGYFGVYDFTIE